MAGGWEPGGFGGREGKSKAAAAAWVRVRVADAGRGLRGLRDRVPRAVAVPGSSPTRRLAGAVAVWLG